MKKSLGKYEQNFVKKQLYSTNKNDRLIHSRHLKQRKQ